MKMKTRNKVIKSMWKLTFFVNCSGWKTDPKTGKRGYENAHYFKTKSEALNWFNNDRFHICPIDLVSLEEITLKEFAEDIILPL